MRAARRITLLTVLFLLSALAVKAEGFPLPDSLHFRYNTFSTWFSPEKVYLHFDRSCYKAGETVWFKGWVQEASSLSVLPPSNFLYVEVLDSGGDALARVKIKRSDGGFPGYLQLPDNLSTGDYTIRAYTLWQLNNDVEYLFHDKIRIVGDRPGENRLEEALPAGVEISFWPEGGRYFAGHKAVIGFKAVDSRGRSTDFSGVLVGGNGDVPRPVSTTHDGMGVIEFLPEPGVEYGIRDASGHVFPLPSPATEGAMLHLWSNAGKYYVGAMGYGGGTASLLVRDASRIRPIAEIELSGEEGVMIVERQFFQSGINHILLVNESGSILAERLFFVRDGAEPVCSMEMSQSSDGKGAPVKGIISLSNPDGTPLDGNCSVSVVREALKDWQQNDGITSYMALSSELKGSINDPFYYFDPDIPEQERDAALDMLMMIQGWRYYDIDKIIDKKKGKLQFRYVREMMQEIRGYIARWGSSRMPKKFTFTFMIPKLNELQSKRVERGRRFVIDSLDFPENTEFLINIGTSRLGAVYLPRWDGDKVADPHVYKAAPGYSKDGGSVPQVLEVPASGDTLQAVVVVADYPDQDLMFGRSYDKDLEFFKDQTLVEYLSTRQALFEYDGEYMYNRSRMRSSIFSESEEDPAMDEDESKTGKVKLIVDDEEASWWSFDMLRLGDLRSLSISTRPDPVYGGEGGVVYIKVKPGGMRRSAERNPSLLYFIPLGYQQPRYFEPPLADDGRPTTRNTIWWSSLVEISGGRAEISFPGGASAEVPYTVRIEGISSDGRPFSRHCAIEPTRRYL